MLENGVVLRAPDFDSICFMVKSALMVGIAGDIWIFCNSTCSTPAYA